MCNVFFQIQFCLVPRSFEAPITATELILTETSNHGCITMSKEITPPAVQWTENIELPQFNAEVTKKSDLPINEEILKIQISDNPTKHQILQDNLQLSTLQNKSLYIVPQHAASVNLPQVEERGKTNTIIASSNVYKSPFRTKASKPSKNQDYVWLDPKGQIVSPPTQDEYGMDYGICTDSQDTNVSLLINCNTSSNIRKVNSILTSLGILLQLLHVLTFLS